MTSDRDVRYVPVAVVVRSSSQTKHCTFRRQLILSSGRDSALKREMHAAMSDDCSSPSTLECARPIAKCRLLLQQVV